MTQSDFGTIDPATKSGTVLASDLNGFRNALNSMHKGSARPSYAVAGTAWIKDVSSTTWELYVFDGTSDVKWGVVNPTTHGFTPEIADNSIATSKLSTSGGTVTGLSADQLDGLDSTAFLRATAASSLTWNAGSPYTIRILHQYQVDANDGAIGAKLNSKLGLVLYGINTENTGIRYGTLVGSWRVDGPLITVGSSDDITAGGHVSAGSGKNVYGNALFMTGVTTSYIQALDAGDGGGLKRIHFGLNGGIPAFVRSDGVMWSSLYGYLHSRFAGYPWPGQQPGRVAIDCGNPLVFIGYEVYDMGTNTAIRPYYRADIANCNCNCNCDCA